MPTPEKLNFIVTGNKKKTVVLMVIVAIGFTLTCISKKRSYPEDERGPQYAGSAQCKNCHQSVYESSVHAAHFNTSSNQLPQSVQEAFVKGKNAFNFNDSTEV